MTAEPQTVVAPTSARRASWAARPLVAVVRAYQLARAGRPSPCRFDPTCSAYALEALRTRGALTGTAFTIRRLARCHPWGGRGFDPVPQKKESLSV